jgi:uncharacterized linocin/CFP29 family protein
MNNLHRELAPISSGAWAQIDEEAARTLKRYMAARRVVDVDGPKGFMFPAVGTGHTKPIAPLCDGLQVLQREVQPLLELRATFELTRQAIDDVERGSNDSDWQPLKTAARTLAFSEDHLVFEGYAEAGVRGMRQETSNPVLTLPADGKSYPQIVAKALNQLRFAGVNGPYALLLGSEPYTAITGGNEDGYPLLEHVRRLVDKDVIWCPAIKGGVVLSTRGGDFDLYLGQDVSIGYLSHSEDAVKLYLQESLTCRIQTSEAVVILAPADQKT